MLEGPITFDDVDNYDSSDDGGSNNDVKDEYDSDSNDDGYGDDNGNDDSNDDDDSDGYSIDCGSGSGIDDVGNDDALDTSLYSRSIVYSSLQCFF